MTSIKYYCTKCKRNHLFNSEIGRKHRGIIIPKKIVHKYTFVLPDGKIWDKNSVFDYPYGILKWEAGCTGYDEKGPVYTNFRWVINTYTSLDKANEGIKTINDMQKRGVWTDISNHKVIKLKKVK